MMAELTSQERLQPSLLDRLTDDAPDRIQESRDQRVFSIDRLRQSVLRDLGWLLNTSNVEQLRDLSAYPEVRKSVINFGVPDLAGSMISTTDLDRLERTITQAILDFEPRIMPNSLRVKATLNDHTQSHNTLMFQIEGDLWSQPLPLQLYLSTTLDLESGQVVVSEQMTA
jgi:type VI secretion system protein ImpF